MLAIALDFLLLAFGCFGYLLKSRLSRALSSTGGVRLKRAYRSAGGLFVRLARWPLEVWNGWRLKLLSKHELGLAKLGSELESLCNANNDGDDMLDEEDGAAAEPADGPKTDSNHAAGKQLRGTINPSLALWAASLYYSNKLLPQIRQPSTRTPTMSSSSDDDADDTSPRVSFYFVTPEADPIACSINWINSDLISFEPGPDNVHSSSSSNKWTRDGLNDDEPSTNWADCDGGGDSGELSASGIDAETKMRLTERKGADVIAGDAVRNDNTDDVDASQCVRDIARHVMEDCDSRRGGERGAGSSTEEAAANSIGATTKRREVGGSPPSADDKIDDRDDRNKRNSQHGTGEWCLDNGRHLNENHNDSERVLSLSALSDDNHDRKGDPLHRDGPAAVVNRPTTMTASHDSGRQPAGERQRPRQHGRASAGAISQAFSVGGKTVSVKAVWSSNANGTAHRQLMVIQQAHEQQAQEQKQEQRTPTTAADNTAAENRPAFPRPTDNNFRRTFCLAEFYTRDKLIALDVRSSLIFYFIQLYSTQLVHLYGVISRLLERAGLIGPSGYCCRLSPRRAKSGKRSSGTSAHGGGGVDDDDDDQKRWLELVAWDMFGCHQSANIEAVGGAGQLMDRYALLLMIVAHLQREQSNTAAHSSNEQIRLAKNLMGFFECFSSGDKTSDHNGGDSAAGSRRLMLVHSGSCVKLAGQSSNKDVRMEIEFADVGDNGARLLSTLAVLDPIEFRLNTGLAERLQLESSSSKSLALELADCEANLTSRLVVWQEICALFSECHTLIANRLEQTGRRLHEDANLNDDRFDILDALFRLADESRAEQRRRHDVRPMVDKIWSRQESDSSAPDLIYDVANDSRNQAKSEEEQKIIRRRTSSGSRLGKLLRHNGLIKGLIYLALFLFIRHKLLSYLLRVQRDLQHELRDEFIALKYMIFPGEFHHQIDGDDDDGISILLRQEAEERAEEQEKARAIGRDRESAAVPDGDGKRKETTSDDEANSGSKNDELQPSDDGAANKADVINKIMEDLLTGILAQAFGGGDLANMDPNKLAALAKMLKAAEEEDGEEPAGEDEMAEFASMMEQMIGQGGQGPSNMETLAKMMDGAEPEGEPPGTGGMDATTNIDSTSDIGYHDYDYDDDVDKLANSAPNDQHGPAQTVAQHGDEL
jgi:hypothetical protein